MPACAGRWRRSGCRWCWASSAGTTWSWGPTVGHEGQTWLVLGFQGASAATLSTLIPPYTLGARGGQRQPGGLGRRRGAGRLRYTPNLSNSPAETRACPCRRLWPRLPRQCFSESDVMQAVKWMRRGSPGRARRAGARLEWRERANPANSGGAQIQGPGQVVVAADRAGRGHAGGGDHAPA